MKDLDFGGMRERMVDEQLIRRGISDEKVIAAFRKVPRHEFLPQELRESAYGDYPLPIGSGQTISQPYMVALMTERMGLKGGEKVLEIGTGSGYQLAILAEIAEKVYSVERLGELAARTEALLGMLGYRNFRIKVGDGTLGWKENMPYGGIIVTAGSPGIPKSIVEQLAEGARLVIPVGSEFGQALTVVQKKGASVKVEEVCGCTFVPLVGKEGWTGPKER